MISDKQRKRNERARKKKRGLVPVIGWVHGSDAGCVKAHIKEINRKREESVT